MQHSVCSQASYKVSFGIESTEKYLDIGTKLLLRRVVLSTVSSMLQHIPTLVYNPFSWYIFPEPFLHYVIYIYIPPRAIEQSKQIGIKKKLDVVGLRKSTRLPLLRTLTASKVPHLPQKKVSIPKRKKRGKEQVGCKGCQFPILANGISTSN